MQQSQSRSHGSKKKANLIRNVEYIIIHHTATTASMDIGFDEVNEWHKARGFNMVGYHMIIRRDGTIDYCRPLNQTGAHCKVDGKSYNHKSIGIALVGGANTLGEGEDNFTPAQLAKLKNTLDVLAYVCPNGQIVRHSDLDPRKPVCPMISITDWDYAVADAETIRQKWFSKVDV